MGPHKKCKALNFQIRAAYNSHTVYELGTLDVQLHTMAPWVDHTQAKFTEPKYKGREQELARLFRERFPFGDVDPRILQAPLHDLGRLSFDNHFVELVGVGNNLDKVQELKVNLRANVCGTPTLNFVYEPKAYSIEGIAGMGKTTLIQKLQGPSSTGGDLEELRADPVVGLLTGLTEDHLYFRHKARCEISLTQRLMDRSNWVAPTVYSAYAYGALFVYLDRAQQDFILNEPSEAVILLPDVPLDTVAERIRARGKMDQHVPLAYTVLTHAMFNVVGFTYGLQCVPIRDFEAAAARVE